MHMHMHMHIYMHVHAHGNQNLYYYYVHKIAIKGGSHQKICLLRRGGMRLGRRWEGEGEGEGRGGGREGEISNSPQCSMRDASRLLYTQTFCEVLSESAYGGQISRHPEQPLLHQHTLTVQVGHTLDHDGMDHAGREGVCVYVCAFVCRWVGKNSALIKLLQSVQRCTNENLSSYIRTYIHTYIYCGSYSHSM